MISLQYGLIIAAIMFSIGLIGTIIRRNILFILLGLEIMLNSSALVFAMAGNYWNQEDGQIMCIIIITIATVEASIGLAFMIRLNFDCKTSNINYLVDEISK